MNIEIDQSGKIENTEHDTVIAFSNGVSSTITLSGKDKRTLQAFFRAAGKPRVFVVKVFALLIFILLRPYLKNIRCISIDREYPGWEHLIKDYLLREIRRLEPTFESHAITFVLVGKKSRAHHAALAVTHKKCKADMKVGASDILRYVVK